MNSNIAEGEAFAKDCFETRDLPGLPLTREDFQKELCFMAGIVAAFIKKRGSHQTTVAEFFAGYSIERSKQIFDRKLN